MRVKRGQQDTSLPGGFYKDQAYLLGAVELLTHLDKIPDLRMLYASKLGVKDLLKPSVQE